MIKLKKLYRSRNNKMLTGLCGGLGEMTNVDANLYRILLVIITFISGGMSILLYIIVSIVIPKTPDIYSPYNQYKNFNGSNPYQGNPYQGNPYQPNNNQGSSYQSNSYPNQPPYPGDTQYTSAPNWQAANPNTAPTQPQNIDAIMDDLEKKALRREIDELKKKLNELEKKGE